MRGFLFNYFMFICWLNYIFFKKKKSNNKRKEINNDSEKEGVKNKIRNIFDLEDNPYNSKNNMPKNAQ